MNVSVKTLNGDIYQFVVSNNETCEQLKSKIENILGFSPSEQKLFFNQGYLDKIDEKLINYGVKDGSIICVSFYPKEFEVSICGFNAEIIKIKTKSGELVKNLKLKVQNICSVSPEEQVLVYNGQVLDDNKSLSDSGITEKCLINVIPKIQEKVNKVEKPRLAGLNYRHTVFFSLKWPPILKVKETDNRPVNADENVNIVSLEDNRRINNNNNNRPPNIKNEIDITCKTMDGKLSKITINPNESIVELKLKIAEKTGIESSQQKLVYLGGLLDDEKQISDYKFENQSVICVVSKPKSKFYLTLKLTNGTSFAVNINGDEKIIHIKEIVQQKLEIPPIRQKLVFAGLVLQNDFYIKDYNISENSTIYLVIRS